MRITINTLDGLGDFVLRIPLLRALEENGHSLQLLVKPPAADLAKLVFPSAAIHHVSRDPYRREVKRRGNPFATDFRAVHKFRPDLYVAALFNLNFFDQVWIEQRFPCQSAGFVCEEDFWSADVSCDPHELAKSFSRRVSVSAALPEIEKNRRMAVALLGREVLLPPPRLVPRDQDLQGARTLLARHGLREGGYWVACVGSRPGVACKDWGEENWREFFSRTASGESVIFLGDVRESASITRLSEGRQGISLNLATDPCSLGLSLALTALSAGYIGRDSGVMHLTAAGGRPVLAVFGGGHWGRFLPVAEGGVVVTQDAPCRGCDYCCAHAGHGCVTEISQETMSEAWRQFREPGPNGLKILETPVPAGSALPMAREASQRYSRLTQEFQRWQRDQERTVNFLDVLGQRLRRLARRNL